MVVSIGRLIADFAHHHPTFTIAGQIVLTRQAGGIPLTDDAYNPLVIQIVLEKIPGPLSKGDANSAGVNRVLGTIDVVGQRP